MKEIKNVFIIGVGAMGAGVAQITARSGFQVKINDLSKEKLDAAFDHIKKSYEKNVKKGRMTQDEMESSLKRITMTTKIEDAHDADLIIEAIIESAEIKKSLFAKLQIICKEDTIFASNTSTVPISDIASEAKYPENFAGLHFFNPPATMKLIEIITGFFTSDETVAAMEKFGIALGKETILSKDTAGFIVNRLLTPMLNEAVILVDKGIGTVEDIDNGMILGCNHPMGPLTLIDFIGADIVLATMEIIHEESGDSKYRPAQLLRRMVRAHQLGCKAGRGFYIYDENGAKVKPNIH